MKKLFSCQFGQYFSQSSNCFSCLTNTFCYACNAGYDLSKGICIKATRTCGAGEFIQRQLLQKLPRWYLRARKLLSEDLPRWNLVLQDRML